MNDKFPEAFKKELEVGKWYKVFFDDDPKMINIENLVFVSRIKNEEIWFDYGFNILSNGWNWEENDWIHSDHIFIEATPQEVETALINEAKKRGFEQGVLMNDIYNGNESEPNVNVSSNIFEWEEVRAGKQQGQMALRDSDGNIIFINGIFATIIETITIQEAEKLLNKKIV